MFSISTILKKLKKYRLTTVIIPVVLVLGGIVFNSLVIDYLPRNSFLRSNTVFGGPKALAQIKDSNNEKAILESNNAVNDLSGASNDSSFVTDSYDYKNASLLNSSTPVSDLLPTREGTFYYKVKEGDTLLRIAGNFDVSLNTILWANPKLKVNLIRPGQEIIILPVTGIIHQVREGETVESIAGLYDIQREKIIKVNPKSISQIAYGDKIIVPNARPNNSVSYPTKTLPSLPGYFGLPTAGRNWGQLHAVNAVDIANNCGTPVYSSAEGLVTEIGSASSWNGGLGGYIEIEHPNRTGTRYAHLGLISVSVGDYVLKNQKIADMGNTGNVRGDTGCHLHFEVRGARNPLAN